MRPDTHSRSAQNASRHAAMPPMSACSRTPMGRFAGVPQCCSRAPARFLMGVGIVPAAPRAGELDVAKEFPFEIALATDIPMDG